MRTHILATAVILAAGSAAADGHVGARVTGDIQNRAGENIGSVSVFETASGVTRIIVQAIDIPPGTHGVHLHEVGECVGDFSSAGDHIGDGMNHGLVEGGPHPGDLPNAYVGEDGELAMEALNERISVEDHLRDADGAALIVHSEADDFVSQPGGAAGDRIACAVLNLMDE
ncbi:superoxide dismutase family protein [Jannaschia sp. LMIT008]|uniref:superoxide dismutase family protein n=1 Tax=Jannaschia maritima TaxID=3032585 RepID=UPI0028124059|nr:superoxide dismutase family protein [Jannaschia sp. LMIT008]